MTRYVVDEESRRTTTKCSYAFQCLEGTREACGVSIYIEVDGLFLKKAKYERCPYKQMVGKRSRYACTCPVRISLYKRLHLACP